MWDEKTRIRLSLAQVQMKLAAGAELGSELGSTLVMQTMTEHSSYLTRANMIMDLIQCE